MAHFQRYSLPPSLRGLKDKIIVIYPVLAAYLITFLVEAKDDQAMEATIKFIQSIKQAALPDSSCEHHCPPYHRKIPHLSISNEVFQIWGQTKIYTDSRPYLCFHGRLYSTGNGRLAPARRQISVPIDITDSDGEEVDVDILMSRKPRKGAGNVSITPPAYTPYFPEVSLQGLMSFN